MHVRHERQKATAYVPITKEAQERHQTKFNELKIIVDYDKGGMNYFNGKQENRGYRIIVSPVTVTDYGGHKIESSVMMGKKWETGLKYFIEVANRYSRKRMEELAEEVEKKLPKIARLYEDESDQAILLIAIGMSKDVVKPNLVCA